MLNGILLTLAFLSIGLLAGAVYRAQRRTYPPNHSPLLTAQPRGFLFYLAAIAVVLVLLNLLAGAL